MINIVFDLDNTLTHREDTINRYVDVFCDDFSSHLRSGVSSDELATQILQLDGNGYAGHDLRSKGIQQLDIWQQRVDLASLLCHWQNWIPNNPSPMPYLHQVLRHFKNRGYSLGIITNGSVKAQTSKIEALNISEYFDAVIISEACGIQKPDNLIFELALSKLSSDRENTYYIGDHPINDYFGALQAGINPIWFRGFHAWPDDLNQPINTVSDLKQCIDLVNNLTRRSSQRTP